MVTIRVLDCLVGKDLPDYKVAIDPVHNLGYILCPTLEIADAFYGHYISLQYDNVAFEQVLSAYYMPFAQDVDQAHQGTSIHLML
ncbi:unnamed protein product [Urochloa humidicola]